MILLDTSGLLAALFVDQRRHAECARVVSEAGRPLVLSPFVLAELDYLVAKLAGEAVERELLAEVARGAYQLVEINARDVEEARVVIERHEGLGIGLADAATVVLSRRLGCLDLLTLDERHFRVLRGFKDRPFRVLPADG
ncbi:MAG: PIN domain-containing protein [Thermoanaerobaculales bacterium]|jgi:predicted nucleic acid-binding protein|nr:PIN domain-containing protein [Thermoanaerobaculales bacterium]